MLAGVFANALASGALASPLDRYQSRVVWLVPLLAILLLADGRVVRALWGDRSRGTVSDPSPSGLALQGADRPASSGLQDPLPRRPIGPAVRSDGVFSNSRPLYQPGYGGAPFSQSVRRNGKVHDALCGYIQAGMVEQARRIFEQDEEHA